MTHPYYAAQNAKPPQRWKLYAPFIGFAVLVLLYTVYWFYAASEVKAEARAWIVEQEGYGYTITHDKLTVGGYPFRLNLIAEAPSITAPQAEGGWSARYDRLSATAMPYNFNHWILAFIGEGEVRTSEHQLGLAAERARLSFISRKGRFHELGVELIDLHITPSENANFPIKALEQFELTSAVDNEDGLQTRLALQGLTLQGQNDPSLITSLGERIEMARFDSRITHSQYLLDEANPESWRAHEGRLNLALLQVEWGNVRFGAQGDLALDDTARPEGRLSVLIEDPNAITDALVEARMLSRDQGDALRLAALMAPRREGGIALPFRLQNGALFLGPARLGDVDPLY
ncbi:DUF2125 domain-containing protein [Woodsholea maritima]|uniref:DUF2125 domain-containing protein n=1 Tax=Woodsholea maritima TaxID=240237 RepID=UPI00037AF7EB|nr:DUF2125 domain-containing protein [Woodsholea maritima]